ncbi:MAG: DUF4411 family protein [Planctomycetota bacterium]|nr:DUF4411 family protein [Planctomycetota bacterium]
MIPTKPFLLDSEVFNQAHRYHYSFDTFPGFWECLAWLGKSRKVISIDKSLNEISGNDKLAVWVRQDGFSDIFMSTEEDDILVKLREIQEMVSMHPKYKPIQRMIYNKAENADPWLIAYAKAKGLTIVTQEKENKGESKIKIPQVCKSYDVKCCNTFEMLAQLGVKFQWMPNENLN